MREQPFFQARQKHDRKLQALGVVQGQQAHLRLLVHRIRVRHQRGVIQENAQGLTALGGLFTAESSSPNL